MKNKLHKVNEFDGQIKLGAKSFNKETNRSGIGKPSSGYMVPEHSAIIKDTKNERYVPLNIEDWQEQAICPVCDEEEKSLFVERLGLKYVRCNKCGHVYQTPLIKQAVASSLYSNDQTSAAIYTVPLQKNIDSIKYNYGLDLIESFSNINKSRILDIGCGAGVFLKEAYKRDYAKCVGIDANDNYKKQYDDKEDIVYISSTFESLSPTALGDPYDVITMWSSLEHIYNPKKFLLEIKNILKPNGILFVLVPNLKSLATRLMREMSPCFNWKHPHYFHLGSLDLLMKTVGLKPMHHETVITEIDNIKSYMSGEYPYHGYGDPEGLFDFITPEYIHSNLLGSRLIAIYKN